MLASDVIEKALSYVLGNDREERNQLSGDIDNSETTLTFTQPLSGIRARSEIEIDSELMYVWSVTDGTRTAVVQRGFKNTTTTTHSDQTIVTVNPRFYRFGMLDDLNNELLALSSPSNGLFQPKSIAVSDFNVATRGYNFTPTDCIDILSIQVSPNTGLAGDWRTVRSYQLLRSMPTTGTNAFASGTGLVIDDTITSGSPIQVIYKADLTAALVYTGNLSTTGLNTQAYDILAMGVALRQNVAREISRNATDSQPDPRRATEVPPGAVANSLRGISGTYQRRINEEAERLARQYPVRSKRL